LVEQSDYFKAMFSSSFRESSPEGGSLHYVELKEEIEKRIFGTSSFL